MQSLQERKKWTNNKRNLKVGDIVILQEANTIRNDWQMCRVIQTYCDDKGFAGSVRLKIGSVNQTNKNKIADRQYKKSCYFLKKKKKLMKMCLNL